MMKEKASIEASLHMLSLEATAASRVAAIFEAAAADYEEKDSLGDLALENPIKRTMGYIETQLFDAHASQELHDAMSLPQIQHHKTVKSQPPSNKPQDSVYESP